MKKYKSIVVILGISLALSACQSAETTQNAQNTQNKAQSVTDGIAVTLSDNASSADSTDVDIDGSTVTIKKEGTYILSGSLSDGNVIVDADSKDKVQLVLDDVNINSESSAAVYVKQADKVVITLQDGTSNTLSNGGNFTAIDDNNIDAVIFSKDDLTIEGSGTLNIKSPADHGIVSKDDLIITDGIYVIDAASHGLSANDCIEIEGGSFDITAGKDALHSNNDEDDSLGYIYVKDGSFKISAGSDGMSALSELAVSGGDITISKSEEGLEARVINISGGSIDITSSDDGINATDKSTETQEQPQEPPEGFEDRGNRELPKDFEDFKRERGENMPQGGFGGGGMETEERANINISGGTIKINAEGDGLDSNGYITVSGGETYVDGPSNGGNGALDYGISASISAGVVIAAGQSQMAQNFGADSTQGTMLVNFDGNQPSGEIKLLDSDGNELLSYAVEKEYNCVVISCPEIKQGNTYIVETQSGSAEVVMDSVVYGNGADGNFGGGFGGHGGGMR